MRSATAAMLILILLVLAGLLYSPWHRHNPAARQACIFSPLESSLTLEAQSHIELAPVMEAIWLAACEPVLPCPPPLTRAHFGRAPPA
ncbi:MAG: hypothetical protein ACP5U2_11815 [Bryobacteraceae bacterium]